MDPKQTVIAMRSALVNARQTIAEQAEMLDSLTSVALIYCIVVKTGHVSTMKRRPRPDDFKVGTSVKISLEAAHKYEDLPSGVTGKITAPLDRDGEFHIEFPRRGEGYAKPEDLELVDTSELTTKKKTVTICANGQLYEVVHPAELKLKPGTFCMLAPSTMQIVSIAPTVQYGGTALVKQIIDGSFCEVTMDGADKVVFLGSFNKSTLEKGDRVILDPSSIIILKNQKKETKDFSVETEMDVSWNDIGGLEEAKKVMIELVELPHKNPAMFKHYNRKMPKGVLLYGPPGCGKTMLGKATASTLMKIYQGKARSSGFIYIKGPEILNRFVGSSEETVRSIFERARKHKQLYGYPATIFIDEADAILSKRGTGISSDVEKTIVPMFLTEMDGLEDSGAFIILATNRPDILDPAIVRDGRIDRKIKITRPTKQSAEEIFMLNIKDTPISTGCTKQQLAKMAVEGIFNKDNLLYDVEFEGLKPQEGFTLARVCNGAMIANIVDHSISSAMERDIAGETMTGITSDDVKVAVQKIYQENRDVNHSEELEEYAGEIGRKVLKLSKFSGTLNQTSLN